MPRTILAGRDQTYLDNRRVLNRIEAPANWELSGRGSPSAIDRISATAQRWHVPDCMEDAAVWLRDQEVALVAMWEEPLPASMSDLLWFRQGEPWSAYIGDRSCWRGAFYLGRGVVAAKRCAIGSQARGKGVVIQRAWVSAIADALGVVVEL